LNWNKSQKLRPASLTREPHLVRPTVRH
jgi:hypothetical protein